MKFQIGLSFCIPARFTSTVGNRKTRVNYDVGKATRWGCSHTLPPPWLLGGNSKNRGLPVVAFAFECARCGRWRPTLPGLRHEDREQDKLRMAYCCFVVPGWVHQDRGPDLPRLAH